MKLIIIIAVLYFVFFHRNNNAPPKNNSHLNNGDDYITSLKSIGLPVDNPNYWWIKYPKRAINEFNKLLNATNGNISTSGNKLIFKERIINNFGTSFDISIEADSGYPFKMPKAFILSPYIKPLEKIHMYTEDGSLCLMKHSDYNSNMSILDIRNSVASWCWCYETYQHTGKWSGALAH